jgi:hypothetical protein
MACILDKMNGRPRPRPAVTVTEVAIKNPPKPRSSLHMSGEFAEIDLASDMDNIKQPPIIDFESGEEPEVRKTLTLFTEDTDSMCDEDRVNNLLNNSDKVN